MESGLGRIRIEVCSLYEREPQNVKFGVELLLLDLLVYVTTRSKKIKKNGYYVHHDTSHNDESAIIVVRILRLFCPAINCQGRQSVVS